MEHRNYFMSINTEIFINKVRIPIACRIVTVKIKKGRNKIKIHGQTCVLNTIHLEGFDRELI